MRLTVDILDSLDQELRKKAKRLGLSFKDALNRTIAAGLPALEPRTNKNRREKNTYQIKAKKCGFKAGIDSTHLNSLLDVLEDEERNKL